MHINLINALFKDHKNWSENMTLADENKCKKTRKSYNFAHVAGLNESSFSCYNV